MKSPAHPRLLVIDVGNSSTSLGLYAGGRIRRRIREKTRDLKYRKARETICDLIGDAGVQGAAIASVAPLMNDVLVKAVRAAASVVPLRVGHRMRLGAPITYPDPERIGEDRLANLAGAVARYDAPVIVVDIGTATTFDIIQRRKGYTGGIIAPGPALLLDYLADKTALLPHVDLAPVGRVVGKSTEQAMRIGALHGYRGMVKEITYQLMKQMKNRKVTLCATGGYASWVLRGMHLPFVYDKDLTLYGIARIYELNT